MNFEYSPGLIGYGAKGSDGSTGLQGLAIYFTDFDPIYNRINIENAIENNYVLWSIAPPNTSLPQNRLYITGDQFIIPNGDIYSIDAEANTYAWTGHSLTKVELFENSGQTSDSYFDRWHNLNFDPSKGHVIIDNVLSDTGLYHYENVILYGISAKNYARIEYTNVDRNGRRGFTVYSTGENQFLDDHKAIAIVLDIPTNTFRIGNIDFLDTITDTNITLDVSGLVHTREAGHRLFAPDSSESGLVLTNIEIDTPEIFSPTFNSSPDSFYGASPTNTSLEIHWDLSEFTSHFSKTEYVNGTYHYGTSVPNLVIGLSYTVTSGYIFWYESDGTWTGTVLTAGDVFTWNGIPEFFYPTFTNAYLLHEHDPQLSADLYFYQEVSLNRVHTIQQNSSLNSPIIFHNIEPSGYLTISPLTYGQNYQFYMSLFKNGWERRSDILTVTAGSNSYYLRIIDPILYPTYKVIHAAQSGWFSVKSSYNYNVDVSVNVMSGLVVTPQDSWINVLNETSKTYPSFLFSFDVSLAANTGTYRTGTVKLQGVGAANTTLYVTQDGLPVEAYFDPADPDGVVKFFPELTDQTYTLTLELYAWTHSRKTGTPRRESDVKTEMFRNGTSQQSVLAHAQTSLIFTNVIADNSTLKTISGLTPADTISLTVTDPYSVFPPYSPGGSCAINSDYDYEESMGWVRIKSFTITSGSGYGVVGNDQYFWIKNMKSNWCSNVPGAGASEPLPV